MVAAVRVLAEIRAAWARPGTKDGWHASRHFDLTCSRSAGQHDDKTWKDLELPKIFAAMDTTVTLVGSQCLFTLLRSYVDPREAAERYDAYTALRRPGVA